MIVTGELLADGLVWKKGMEKWEKACLVDDLKELFPPEIK